MKRITKLQQIQRWFYNLLPQFVRTAHRKRQRDACFKPENEVPDSRREYLSPSGKYKLVVSQFTTAPGCWNYSQGKVYQTGSDQAIATINRNYGSFPFLFLEKHPNSGHDYLICGEDYQGQTVVELTTGRTRNNLSEGSDEGYGFCWSDYRYHPAPLHLLEVSGCFWACSYETKFFDFFNPMQGWLELKMYDVDGEETSVEADEKPAEMLADGGIKVFNTHNPDDDEAEDEEEELSSKFKPVRSYRVFRRENDRLVEVENWVSEEEKQYRIDQEKSRQDYDAYWANFRQTDALYLEYKRLLVADLQATMPQAYRSVDYTGQGSTYEGWCPDFSGSEARFTHRIVEAKSYSARNKYTVDLDWGVKTAPIKLTIFYDGNLKENKFFPHSLEGMREAFAYVKGLLK